MMPGTPIDPAGVPPSPAPDLSIVIPSRNGAGRLGETLDAIARQEVAGRVQVVVVDDGSSDGTREVALAARLPWGPPCVVRHETPGGRAAACNSGIAAAAGGTVLILDDDMTLEAGALEAHLRAHAARERCAAVGRIVQARGPGPASCFQRFLDREESNRERQLLENRGNLPFPLCMTGHFSLPRSLLVEAGGYDTSILHYGLEDIELAYRLVTRGVRMVYLPQAGALHRAYMVELDRYLRRHFDVGKVARQLAERYTEGPFREYLRVDGPSPRAGGAINPGLAALRLSNRLLLKAPVRAVLGSSAGQALLAAFLGCAGALHLDRITHFGYHVARDVQYFQGYFGAPGAGERP